MSEVAERPFVNFPVERKRAADRLIQARKQAGYVTGTSFARENRFPVSTYLCHENGSRGLDAATEAAYAEKLGIPPGSILYGGTLPRARDIPIVGTIEESAARVVPMPDGMVAGTIHIELNGLVGHRITGNALAPVYRDGDFAMTLPLNSEGFELAAVHGCECVCRLEDGTEILRQISVQADGLCTLIAYQGPAQFNVRVVAAQPVELVVRGNPAARLLDLL